MCDWSRMPLFLMNTVLQFPGGESTVLQNNGTGDIHHSIRPERQHVAWLCLKMAANEIAAESSQLLQQKMCDKFGVSQRDGMEEWFYQCLPCAKEGSKKRKQSESVPQGRVGEVKWDATELLRIAVERLDLFLLDRQDRLAVGEELCKAAEMLKGFRHEKMVRVGDVQECILCLQNLHVKVLGGEPLHVLRLLHKVDINIFRMNLKSLIGACPPSTATTNHSMTRPSPEC